jgi:CBS domain containing-hemolysin-like protein
MIADRDEMPTLRLVTLRRLVRRSAPVTVVHASTTAKTVSVLLRASPRSTAVVVDRDGVLLGTLCLEDLAGVDPSDTADHAMVEVPIMAPEHDADAALVAMYTHARDRVLVVDADGRLLGVLTRRDVSARTPRHSRLS